MFVFFFCRYEKGLLNFVSERIKLVNGINNTRLAWQTSKTTIYRPQTSEFQLFFHWKNFENKTLRSVHFGVVVVELIYCKCGGIVRHEIW